MFKWKKLLDAMLAYVLAVCTSAMSIAIIFLLDGINSINIELTVITFFVSSLSIFFLAGPGFLIFLLLFRFLGPNKPYASMIAGAAIAFLMSRFIFLPFVLEVGNSEDEVGWEAVFQVPFIAYLPICAIGLIGGLTWWLAATRLFD